MPSQHSVTVVLSNDGDIHGLSSELGSDDTMVLFSKPIRESLGDAMRDPVIQGLVICAAYDLGKASVKALKTRVVHALRCDPSKDRMLEVRIERGGRTTTKRVMRSKLSDEIDRLLDEDD